MVGIGFSFVSGRAAAREGSFKQEAAEHFIIHYQQGVSRREVAAVKNLAEKYYRTITQEFHLIRDELWIWDKRAKIFIAEDRDNYSQHFNCQSWSDACVDYERKIIYTYPGQVGFSNILVHELTHIIFREYAGRNILPLWLDEGIATYMENKYGSGYYQRFVQKVFRKKLAAGEYIGFSELTAMSPAGLSGKEKSYIDLFYGECFSLVYFIITKYGTHNFSRFIAFMRKGLPVKEALAKVYFDFRDFGSIEKKWENYYIR